MSGLDTSHPWRFEVCKACGRNNVAGFRVTDAMWERVMGGRGFGVACIFCFDEFAAERGVDWTEEPIEFNVVSTVANAKWHMIEDVTPQSIGG